MVASYKKLFKILIDLETKKKELAEKAVVSSEVLIKIYVALECTMDDTVDIVPDKSEG